jgi:hypothetical protein
MDDGTAVVVLLVEDETLVRLLANDILSEAGLSSVKNAQRPDRA